jgi:hypothetical protein
MRCSAPSSAVSPLSRAVGDQPTLMSRFARLRVPLGFACGALVLWLAAPTRATLLIGAPVAAVGEAMRIWASGHVHKGREITASGPYRWFAHPLYVGSSMMACGLALACASTVAAGLIAVYLAVTLTAAVKIEEAFLRRRFGDRYERYRRGDKAGDLGDASRGIAGVATGIASDHDGRRRFSFAQAMRNREYRAVVGLALAVLLLTLKATYNQPFGRAVGTRSVRPGG